MQEGIFYKSLGTLGGGNHFIEYGEDAESGESWLTIHCGSRNLGVKVANYWHNMASNPKRAEYVGYLWGDALTGYLSDMVIAQAYAIFNHDTIRDRIVQGKMYGINIYNPQLHFRNRRISHASERGHQCFTEQESMHPVQYAGRYSHLHGER